MTWKPLSPGQGGQPDEYQRLVLTRCEPLVAAWLGLGETLTLAPGGGAALALAGVVLARRHIRPSP